MNKVFLRSFFLQATWNFERMQNLGFCYAILPVLKELYKDEAELRRAIERHLEFFNTHPYMAGPILGAVAVMEEKARNGAIDSDDIKGLKAGVMGSCGAIGDSLFWGGIKPFASAVSVLLLLFNVMLAPVIFLAIYNVPHLWLRVYGFYGGSRVGADIFDRMGSLNLSAVTKRIKLLTVAAAGALLAALSQLEGGHFSGEGALVQAAWIIAVFLLFSGMIRRGMSSQYLFYLSLVLAVAYSAFDRT